MSALPPGDVKGFGKAVRLATAHRFRSRTTRAQTGDPEVVKTRLRLRRASLVAHGVAVLAAGLLSGWIWRVLDAGMSGPPSVIGTLSMFGAILVGFLGIFGFVRLVQVGWRALIDGEEADLWPREGVDWGTQTVVLDRDGIAVALKYARRTWTWNTMAELHEDGDVFVVERKEGARLVIPKDPADEDDMRDRLFRGITLSKPL